MYMTKKEENYIWFLIIAFEVVGAIFFVVMEILRIL